MPGNKSLIEQRGAAGQCFKCGNKYHPGHICSTKSLNTPQGVDDILEIYDEDCLQEELQEEELGNQEEKGLNPETKVSIHALSGEKQQNKRGSKGANADHIGGYMQHPQLNGFPNN